MYMYGLYVCTAGMNIQYQIQCFVKKSFEGFEFSHTNFNNLFIKINVALTFFGFRKPPKLKLVLILSLFPLGLSITEERCRSS